MDKKDIFELLEKFEASSLSELRLEREDLTILLKREMRDTALSPPATPSVVEPSPFAAVPRESGTEEKRQTEIITAPLVGTFYRAPAPDAPAFVEEGSVMSKGDTLCILEAMKMMNKLEAERNCRVVRILVENGALVEFGAPLFEVEPV